MTARQTLTAAASIPFLLAGLGVMGLAMGLSAVGTLLVDWSER